MCTDNDWRERPSILWPADSHYFDRCIWLTLIGVNVGLSSGLRFLILWISSNWCERVSILLPADRYYLRLITIVSNVHLLSGLRVGTSFARIPIGPNVDIFPGLRIGTTLFLPSHWFWLVWRSVFPLAWDAHYFGRSIEHILMNANVLISPGLRVGIFRSVPWTI